MKKYLLLLVAVLLAVPSVSFSAGKADATDTVTVESMAGEVVKFFPRAEGRVSSADEKTVAIDIGSAAGLKPGMEMFLTRPGKAIRHPVTKAILGNTEIALGRMALTRVDDNTATGEIRELKVTRIIPGDIARLSTDRTKLLVAVYGTDYNELVLDRLMSTLSDSGRFEVLPREELPKGAELAPEAAAALMKEKGAANILALSTAPTKRVDRTKVGLQLYSRGGETLSRQGGLVDVTSEVYGEKVMDFNLVRGEHRDFFHIEDLPYRARHMSGGNLTGQGKTELAVSDGKRITVYRIEQGLMKEMWSEDTSPANQHLDVECADLNGNGTDEIYVTDFANGTMSSYVIEYDGHGFKKIAENLPALLRVLDVPGSGKILIAGTMGRDLPYSGYIYQYKWKDGGLVRAGRLSLPDKIKDPYGFVLMDLVPGKDKPTEKAPFAGLEIVWVDDADFIQVLDPKGKRLWKSPERYGGYDNFFEAAKTTMSGPDNRGKVRGKLILRDGPEGDREIVLTKNITMTNVLRRWKGYSGAEIYSLVWNNGALEQRWSVKNIDGYLADIYLGDASNSGREEITIITDPTFKVVKSSKRMPLGSAASLASPFMDKSSLLIYKVPQR